MDNFSTSALPLSRIVSAIRVKSPFSHNALFGFIAFIIFGKINQLRVNHIQEFLNGDFRLAATLKQLPAFLPSDKFIIGYHR
jgi:hypothetical protein